MTSEKELIKELKILQEKKASEKRVKQLKKQIKSEKFMQTRGGKIFHKIADVGEVGLKATKKFLSPPQQVNGKKITKKSKKKVQTVQEVMANMEKAVNQFSGY